MSPETSQVMSNYKKHPASFRDPAGFVFEYDSKFYRQVNQSYAENYALLMKGGLYDLLLKEKKILPHTDTGRNLTGDPNWFATLEPEQLHQLSYPYEWCFSMWKDAALLTLELQQKALAHGMVLKDATPFNIQYVKGKPVLIDTLSFEKYNASTPWIAYRQFVECFLAPLLLTRYRGAEMLKLFQLYPDGLPLQMVGRLLPAKSWLNLNVFLHVHLPGMIKQDRDKASKKQPVFTKEKMNSIVSNLFSFVKSLSLQPVPKQWSNYYEETILSREYFDAKMNIVKDWLKELPGLKVTDLGANTGLFSLAAAEAGKAVIAVDADTACMENLYKVCKGKKIDNVLCLCTDITNPTPGIGWNNSERKPVVERLSADITMALALIHHLCIGKNISFEQVALVCVDCSPWLIIEFVPEMDPKVQLLLQQRENIFFNYNERDFVQSFEKKFTVVKRSPVPGTGRVLFMMERHSR